ncbi:hypothetical protein NM208_g12751 [Fusarium decemcellulare]|uniref:Uncharacterized protein n=1 Tax=Fusarium decemcellulare TaxID=57161 RepID=A0ACC1RPZ1_9HYPO|nr:hypothetical protein NM208_g12751 [Fusarium decemcellulare]
MRRRRRRRVRWFVDLQGCCLADQQDSVVLGAWPSKIDQSSSRPRGRTDQSPNSPGDYSGTPRNFAGTSFGNSTGTVSGRPRAIFGAHFYEIIDVAYKIYQDRLAIAQFNEHSNWIISSIGKSHCFGGLSHAFPTADVSEAIQIATHVTVDRRAQYHLQSFSFSIIKFDGKSQPKVIYVTMQHTPKEFQNLLTRRNEMSHVCNWKCCINPCHQIVEDHDSNLARETWKIRTNRAR